MRPVEPGAGQQAHCAAIEPRMHPIVIELDFVEPLRAIRRFVDKPSAEVGSIAADHRQGSSTDATCRSTRGVRDYLAITR
jgi:hypothetical protein